MPRTEYDEIKSNLIKKSLDQKEQEVVVPEDRRKGEDGILRFINLMSFLLWGALVVIFSIILKAGENLVNTTPNNFLWFTINFWNLNLLKIALIITIICICICTISIILNFSRHRRRTDRIKRSLIICEAVCFVIGFLLILKLFY